MKKVLIGWLVGICVIMFSSPLLAADSPVGIDLSSLQVITDSQLSQMRGQGVDWSGNLPPGIAKFTYGTHPPGVWNAEVKINHQAEINSRVFINVNYE